MNIKSFFDNPEELFMGAVLQFPIYYVVGWWVLPIMLACGLLWRFGGAADDRDWDAIDDARHRMWKNK